MFRRIRGLLLAVVAVVAADGRLQAQAPAPASVEHEVATAPVEIDGRVLFRLRGVSSFPAAERARLVTDRIVAAAADPAASVDGLRVVEGDRRRGDRARRPAAPEDPRCRRGARAGPARRARARPHGPGASGDRRLSRGPHARREGTERHHHARRDPRPRARHRADRVALAPPRRADDRAHGAARPDGRHPVVRGGARGPDTGSAEKRRPRTPDRRHPRRDPGLPGLPAGGVARDARACPATSSASCSRRSR